MMVETGIAVNAATICPDSVNAKPIGVRVTLYGRLEKSGTILASYEGYYCQMSTHYAGYGVYHELNV